MAVRTDLTVDGLRSLAWAGEDLVDWIGGRRVRRDGTVTKFGSGYVYRFDGTAGIGDLGVMFETLGTKGRIVRSNGRVEQGNFLPLGIDEVRQINRDCYQADAYAYPVCLFRLPDCREAIAHCPQSYDTLEIETIDGTALTHRTTKPEDIFHSRLSVSMDGRWLLSNGWVWHPCNVACVYDVARALVEPAHLASRGIEIDLSGVEGEADTAALLPGDRLVVASWDSPLLSVIDLLTGQARASVKLDAPLGTQIMAWSDHVVVCDDHPRVVALDGTTIETFDIKVETWAQPSVNLEPPQGPWVAMDPAHTRFAVGDPDGRIVVIEKDRPANV